MPWRVRPTTRSSTGLVEGRRDGRWVYYTANEAGRDAVRGFLDELQSSIHRPHLADDCCEKRDSA